ncbi:MAG: type II CAAX endopeptidase family protein [Candidatus Eisenbacteria bacterium]
MTSIGPPTADHFADKLRGFGPVGILAIVAILSGNLLFAPLSGILVLVWARRSRTPWHEIGYVRPRSWILGLIAGVVFGVAFKLLMKAIVMPLLGADPINHAYRHLVGNQAALPGIMLQLIVTAGIFEETLYRGYMFERLGKLLGRGVGAKISSVLITSALFGPAHYIEQGLPGVQQATIFALVFGTIFAITGRLWVLMCAHAAFDLAALWIIYWDLEARVAHFFFQ